MRALLRVALALLLAAAAGIGAVAWLLPRWVEGEDFRELLLGAARDATGRDVGYDELSLSFFPLRLVATKMRVGDAAAPLVVSERVAMSVALAPLLQRVVQIDSLALDAVTWRIVRGAGGIELPIAKQVASREVAPLVPRFQQAAILPLAITGETEVRLAVRSVELHRSRIVWDDRAAEPPLSIEVRDVEGRADGTSATAPVSVSLAGTLASGGTLRIDGTATLAGALDLSATLDALDLTPFAAYFGRDFALGGRVGGTLRARGPAARLEALDAELAIDDAALHAGPVTAQGPIALKAQLHGAIGAPEGDVEIDATRATLSAYGGAFQKAPGAPATATGKLVRDAKGRIGLDDVRLSIKNMNGRISPQPDGLRLDAAPFDLAGWGELVPALAAVAPEGPIAFEGVRVASAPFSLAGRVALDGVRLRPEGRAPIALRGALVGDGPGFRSDALVATIGGQAVTVALAVHGDGDGIDHRLHLATQDADLRALLEALAGRPDLLEGPATIRADLAGPLGAAALAQLAGQVDLAVGAGRIPNVSPLRAAIDGLARYDESAQIFDRAEAEKALAPYLTDRFQSITGSFAIGGGRARTQELVLRYPGYQVELRGSVGLADQRLDLAGRIALGEEILSALAGERRAAGRRRAHPRSRARAGDRGGSGVRDRPGRRDRLRGELRAGTTSRQTRAQDRQTARRGNRRRAPRRARPVARQEEAGRSMSSWFTLRWSDGGVVMLDQRKLPRQELYVTLRSVEEVAQAIETMVVRGAPAIGCAAALGVALAARASQARTIGALRADVEAAIARLARTRPTAVNLFWALGRIRAELEAAARCGAPTSKACAPIWSRQRSASSTRTSRSAVRSAARASKSSRRTLASSPTATPARSRRRATARRSASSAPPSRPASVKRVLADETRPFLQGARLTAWELPQGRRSR